MSASWRRLSSLLSTIAITITALVASAAGPAAADTLIPVGANPRGVALDPADEFAYVANANGNSVSVIDTAADTVTALIGVAANPYYLAVDPHGPRVYVPGFAGDAVSFIDTTTNTATAITDPSFDNPLGVAFNPDPTRTFAYVVNYSFGSAQGSVSLIDTTTNTVAGSVVVGREPRYVAVTPSGMTGYVTNSADDSVSVLDLTTTPPTVTTTLAGFPDAAGLAVTPDGSHVYVANIGDDTVSVVRTSDNAIVRTISLTPGAAPSQVAFTPNGAFAYVTNPGTGSLSVIDATTGAIAQTRVGLAQPWGTAVASTGAFGYVTQEGNSSVLRFDAPTITSLTPTNGTVSGGTTVTITGTGFNTANAVRFGATAVDSFTIVDDEHITVDTPVGAPGPVEVSVTSLGLQASSQFIYFLPVTIIAGNATMIQGDPLPPIGHSAVQSGTSTPVALTGDPTCRAYTDGTYAVEVSPATGPGTYVTHCTGGTVPANHTIQTYVDGTLTVSAVTPTPTPTVTPEPTTTPTPTPTQTPVPAPVTGVKASGTAKAVKASWQQVPGATGYSAKLTGKNPKNKKVVKTKQTRTTTVTFKVKLKKKSAFKVCITASNVAGQSPTVCKTGKVK